MTFNPDAVSHWLERVYGQAPGLLSVAHQDKGGKFHAAGGTVDTHNDAAQLVARLDRAAAHSIYLRTTTLTARPSAGGRGGGADALALPGFWADVDFGDVGHRHDPAKHNGRPLPPDAAEAKRIVTESGLPAPSLWVHSGGGLYPWWLLDQPLILDDDNRPGITAMSASWQQALQRSAHRLGYEYGAGVGDLARVLRIPGTVNRKDGKARPCQVVQDDGTAYTLADLTSALQKATPAPSPAPAPAAPLPRSAFDTTPRTGASAFDLLDQHATFDDILTGADWIRCTAGHASNIEACWTRPGNPEHSCSAHTLAAMPQALVVFSESAGLPVGAGQKLTRGRLFAHLWHHGDERASALDLYAAIGGRPSTPAAAALPLPREARRVNTASTIGLQDLVALEHQQAQYEANRPPDDQDPDETAEADQAVENELAFNRGVSDELHKLRIRKSAQELFKAENQPDAPPFDAGTLAEILARPPEPAMRVDGLIPWDAAALIVAARKVGKTTFDLNLTRSLLTGEDFLGKFAVRPIDGIVAILNYEVSAGMLGRWADDAGIDRERFYIVTLRGRRNPLGHAEDRAILAEDLRGRGVESLIVDPFGKAYIGKSQNDPGEVGAWLADLDLFARTEVGAKDLILNAHAGWNGERTRGASALEDWADTILTITRDPEDETLRFLRAEGRDVEIPEDRLDFDPATRTLTMSGTGSRKKSKDDRKLADLTVFTVRAARQQPGIGVAEMEKSIRDMDDAPTFRHGDVSKAAKRAAELGHLTLVGGGSGKRTSHFITPLADVQT